MELLLGGAGAALDNFLLRLGGYWVVYELLYAAMWAAFGGSWALVGGD